MEYLKQVNPDEWEQTPPLVELYNILPKTLRCSPHKNNTDFRRKTPHQATKNAYIGYNTPNVTSVIVIDLDYKDSKFAYSDLGLPRPQFITENKKNTHSQYIFILKDPVTFFKNSRNAPIRLLNAVIDALTDALGGDKAFTGYLAKNALNSSHNVYYTGAKPYTLTDLANYLDLTDLNSSQVAQADNDDCYGRNDSIFNAVRKQAYSIAFKCNYTQLYNQCLHWCEEYNTRYSPQLPYNELKSISKSIAQYCTSDRFRREFSELQVSRGTKGGKARSAKYQDKREQAKKLHEQGVNNTQIALKLGVSRRTVINWLKK